MDASNALLAMLRTASKSTSDSSQLPAPPAPVSLPVVDTADDSANSDTKTININSLVESDGQTFDVTGAGSDNVRVVVPQSANPPMGTSSRHAAANDITLYPSMWKDGMRFTIAVSKGYVAYAVKAKSGGAIRVINLATGSRTLLKGFTGMVMDIAFSSDPNLNALACVDACGQFMVWSLWEVQDAGEVSSAMLFRMEQDSSQPPSGAYRVCWDPTGTWIATISSSDTTIWSIRPAYQWLASNSTEVVSPYVGDLDATKTKSSLIQTLKENEEYFTLPVIKDKMVVDFSFAKQAPPIIALGYDDSSIQILLKQKTFQQARVFKPPRASGGIKRLFFCSAAGRQVLVTIDGDNERLIVWDADQWVQVQCIQFDRPSDAGSLLVCTDPTTDFIFLTERQRGAVYALRLESSDGGGHVPRITGITSFPLSTPVLSMVVTAASCKLSSSENAQGSLEDENLKLDTADYTFDGYCISARKIESLEVRFASPVTDWKDITAAGSNATSVSRTAGMDDLLSLLKSPPIEPEPESVPVPPTAPKASEVPPPPDVLPPVQDPSQALLTLLGNATKSASSMPVEDVQAPAEVPSVTESSPAVMPSSDALMSLLKNMDLQNEPEQKKPEQKLLQKPESVPEVAGEVNAQLTAQKKQLEEKDKKISALLSKLEEQEKARKLQSAHDNKVKVPSTPQQGMEGIYRFMQQQKTTIELMHDELTKQRQQMMQLRTDFSRSESKLLAELQSLKKESTQTENKVESEKTKRLLSAISSTFHASISSALAEASSGPGASGVAIADLVPAIESSVERALGDSLVSKLSGALAQGFNMLNDATKATVPKLMTSSEVTTKLANATAKGIVDPVSKAVKTAFEGTIVPAIQESYREMLGQTNTAIAHGWSQHISAISPQVQASLRSQEQYFASLIERQQLMQELMQRQQVETTQVLSTVIKDAVKEQQIHKTEALPQPNPAAQQPPQKPTFEMLHEKVKQSKYQEAFTLALAASDLNLVLRLCKSIEPSYLFNLRPLPLEQAVVLSLVQQLTQELEIDTDYKMGYLQEAVMAISLRDPATQEYIPMVLQMLERKLHELIANPQTTPAAKNSMKMLIKVISTAQIPR